MSDFVLTILSNDTPARLRVTLPEPAGTVRLAPAGVTIDERPVVTDQQVESDTVWPEDHEILAEASAQLGRPLTSVRWVSEGDGRREAIYEVA